MQNSGIILLNKPVGISSNSAVNKVKYLIKAKKAGHLGTLDPLASGVLPITFGKATKLFDYFLTKEKTYKATFVFGFSTDTLDSEGKVEKVEDVDILENQIEKILGQFIGKIRQLPPKYSALKINGQKAYELVRSGKEVNLESRLIEVKSITFERAQNIENLKNFFFEHSKDEKIEENRVKIENSFKNCFNFEINCGAGTYIRSLCRDIAAALGTVGTMVGLERTKCGKFKIENCVSFSDIEKGNFKVVSPNEAVDLAILEISKEEAKKLLCGQAVFKNFEGQRKLICDKEFLGIASSKNGKLKIDTYLKEE